MMKISDREITRLSDWLGGGLKEGSAKDLEARRALAKALRYGPPDRGLLRVLADLIEPDADIGLRLVFKRTQGTKRTMDRRKVAAIIWEQVNAGIKKEAAVADAMKKCNVKSRDKALAAYNEYKPIFERHGSKLKALTRTESPKHRVLGTRFLMTTNTGHRKIKPTSMTRGKRS
jgi:hypothetical protein